MTAIQKTIRFAGDNRQDPAVTYLCATGSCHSLDKIVGKSIAKKENKTAQDQFMEKALGKSFDHSSREQIVGLAEYVRGSWMYKE